MPSEETLAGRAVLTVILLGIVGFILMLPIWAPA